MNMRARITTLREEYRSSLKAIAAEELVDLVMFRPLAFVIARSLKSSPVRPIHVTLLSMIIGITGGILLGVMNESGLKLAALFIWLSTVLDCADGQLARLQKSSSPMGRMLDGVIDYAVGVSIFVGIGIRGTPAVSPIAWWGVVVAAGASYALQAMMYDLFRTEYLGTTERTSRGEGHAISGVESAHESGRIVRWVYERYTGFQRFPGSWLGAVEDNDRTRQHLRIWGLNGTSAHLLFLVAACLVNRPDLYLIYLIVVGNGLTLGLILGWRLRINKSTKQRASETTTIEI